MYLELIEKIIQEFKEDIIVLSGNLYGEIQIRSSTLVKPSRSLDLVEKEVQRRFLM
jgi:hypothetical protein